MTCRLSDGGSNPGYNLVVDGNTEADVGGENFGSSVSVNFGDCADSSSCTPLKLKVITDAYGYETSLTLISDGNVIWDEGGFANKQVYEFTECLDPTVCSELTVRDTYGDGIFAPGKIVVTVDGKKEYNRGDFGDEIAIEYGNC